MHHLVLAYSYNDKGTINVSKILFKETKWKIHDEENDVRNWQIDDVANGDDRSE